MGSRSRYIALRRSSLAMLESGIEELNDRIGKLRADLMILGHTKLELQDRTKVERIQTKQRQLKECRLLLRRKQALLGATKMQDISDEYDVLSRLFGVYRIEVNQTVVKLSVCAQIRYQGITYDNGDWRLTLDLSRGVLDTYLLREHYRLRLDEMSVPPYVVGAYCFCFGDTHSLIEELAKAGDVAGALSLAAGCLHSINDGDQEFLPVRFYEWSEHEH